LAYARDQRLKEIHMWSIIREVTVYLCFIWILYVISYSNRNNNDFLQVNHLRHFFLNIGSSSNDYTQVRGVDFSFFLYKIMYEMNKISTIDQYWKWLEESFVSNIRAQQWYNGDPPRNLSGFINDKSNRLIGWATMRQLRVKLGSLFFLILLTSIIE
jgi:hypothetical protein